MTKYTNNFKSHFYQRNPLQNLYTKMAPVSVVLIRHGLATTLREHHKVLQVRGLELGQLWVRGNGRLQHFEGGHRTAVLDLGQGLEWGESWGWSCGGVLEDGRTNRARLTVENLLQKNSKWFVSFWKWKPMLKYLDEVSDLVGNFSDE